MTTTTMQRRRRALALLATAAALTAVLPASAAPAGKTYQAPFKVGASGGDQFSYHSASSDGTVTVARVYPVPGVINCTKGGPYAKLIVAHKATKPVRKIVLSYDSAAVDNFTFVMLGLRDAQHHWYGSTTVRGFVSGSGTVTLVPDQPQGHFPRALTVEFGLQQSSACPNADAGSIKFTKVEVLS
jgi:hypothetical protein